MGSQDDSPLCAHQVHTRTEGIGVEPALVCSCPAGLIHMHDCPLVAGLSCLHHEEPAEVPRTLEAHDFEKLHAELMEDFLTRPYYHRVRSLAPAGDPWQERRRELAERFPVAEAEEETAPDADGAPDEVDETYRAERERLLRQRRKKEEQRKEREEQEQREKAERARARLEEALRKAEARAAREKPDSPAARTEETPKRGRRRRGRRRTSKASGSAPEPSGATPGPREKGEREDGKQQRRRRRRRRRKPDGGASS